MIVWNGMQGTDDWHAVRRGVVTASCFGRIMTPTTLKAATGQDDYLNQLVAESVNAHEGWQGNRHTERGHELEPMAADYYAAMYDAEVASVGFVFADETRRVGGSPDRLVGDSGGLEIKCPDGKKHVANLRSGVVPAEYLAQVYGLLYVTKRPWWDWMSFHPQFKNQSVIRTEYDSARYQEWKAKWEPAIEAFLERLEQARAFVCGDD